MIGLAGCAGVKKPPVPPRPAPGYEARRDELNAVDTTWLRGRRIALDPGHGGRFRGSLGLNGLTEADANLGVALKLRDLLTARGAIVFMTRDSDRDFLSPADSSLRADLAERTRLANAFEPDLFVSIHHNADAGGAHDVNETQTYYKLGDEGPSLDAAESVHRYLVRNLGIASHKILPGNYFVLRNLEAPALLTESSYITNPDVEAKLVQPAKQELEAEALFLGIAHYFARGAPVVESFEARATPDAPPDTTFTNVAAPVFTARVRDAFDEYSIVLDGRPLGIERFDGRLVAHDPGVIANGRHEAVLRVRRAGSGAALPVRRSFVIARPIASATATAWPTAAPPGATIGVRLALLDPFGRAVPDTIPLHVVRDRGARDTLVTCIDGVAWIYFAPARPGRIDLEVVPLDGRDGHWTCSTTVGALPDSSAPWTGFALSFADSSAPAPLREAPGTREPDRAIAWLNRDGFAVLPRDADGRPLVPRLPGYRTWADSTPADGVHTRGVRLVPVAGGVLRGRRITIDPDGGGEQAAGVGPSGTRAAHVNLRVARILRGFLEAAGADVRLTRDGDFALSEVERVQISEAFHADRYLRIGHRAEPPRLGHFYSSTGGKAWATRTGETLQRFGFAIPAIGDDAQYPLQQTSCPALYVSVARIDAAASEDALLAPGAMRAEAYALFVSIAREWAGNTVFQLDSIRVEDEDRRPVPGAAVTVGDAIMLETDAGGMVRFVRTEPGPVGIRAVDSRVRASMILLESMRGAILTGPSGR